MTKSRKRKARKQRRKGVERTERVKPPPEAAQHRRAWPLQTLLVAGPEGGGIDADEFESALQIVEAFHALTLAVDMRGSTLDRPFAVAEPGGGMSDRDATMVAVWFEWSQRLPRGNNIMLVEWIEDSRPIASVAGLRWACRLWHRVKDDYARQGQRAESAIDKSPPDVLTLRAPLYWGNGESPYLPVQAVPALPAPFPPPRSPLPTGAQMRQATPAPRQRPDAQPPTHPPAARLRR